MNRSGFTLIELIVVTVVMAVLGTALTRILIDDSRFVDKVDAMMAARQVSRAAMSVISPDLQMMSDGGLLAATEKGVTLRVPFAFGIVCRTNGANTTASLVPTDSMIYEEATASGIAWRDSDGSYNFLTGITAASTSDDSECAADSIKTVPDGRLITMTGAGAVSSGNLFYLYESVTYSFEASGDLSGRIGLFRTDGSGTKEELLTPFDTAAGFAFLVGDDMTSQASAPADLTTVRGLQLKLTGESYFIPQNETEPAKFDLRTSVAFRNMMN